MKFGRAVQRTVRLSPAPCEGGRFGLVALGQDLYDSSAGGPVPVPPAEVLNGGRYPVDRTASADDERVGEDPPHPYEEAHTLRT